MDKELPSLANERKEKALPTLTTSKMDSPLPNLARPYRLIELPHLIKLRIDTADAIPTKSRILTPDANFETP
jgi:hypothetical protein